MRVENWPKIDLRDLKKHLKEGTVLNLSWKYRQQEVSATVQVCELSHAKLQGTLVLSQQQITMRGYKTANPNKAGFWLVCPVCGSLRFWLAMHPTQGHVVGCRSCLRLRYKSESRRNCIGEYQDRASSAKYKADRLQAAGHTRKAARWRLKATKWTIKDHEIFQLACARFAMKKGWI